MSLTSEGGSSLSISGDGDDLFLVDADGRRLWKVGVTHLKISSALGHVFGGEASFVLVAVNDGIGLET